MRKSTICVFAFLFALTASVTADPLLLFYTVDGTGAVFDAHTYFLDVGAGGEPIDITPPEVGAASPTWSPDGRQILFSSLKDGDPDFNYDLYTMDRDGGNLRMITETPDIELDSAWSPDGRRVAYCVGNPSKSRSLWMLDLDSNVKRELVPIGGELLIKMTRLAWSPDGRQIAFNAIAGGNVWGLYTVHVDTKRLDLLHEGLWATIVYDWLSTDEFLVLVIEGNNERKLGLLSPGGGFEVLFPEVQEKLVVLDARATRRPGLFVLSAVPVDSSTDVDVYRVKRNGTGLQQLTFGDAQEYSPDLWTDSLDVPTLADRLTTTWGAMKTNLSQ